jgi:outer membrane translocation and assembly module TamA
MPTYLARLRHLIAAAVMAAAAPLAPAQQSPGAEPLVIQEIRCSGNSRTSCDYIRGHLHLDAGQGLDEEEVRNAELRLSASRIFETVDIRLEKGAERGAVIVVIDVEEAASLDMEWVAGGSSRQDMRRGVIAGRLAWQNLFGEGNSVELSAIAKMPIAGDAYSEAYDVRLRYADPQLFDSPRWFGVAGASWRKRRFLDRYGNFGSLDAPQIDLTVGWRFGDFSYFAVTQIYRPDNDWISGRWNSDGSFVLSSPESFSRHPARLVYGWSSEDDLHFPTQGSTFQLTAGGDYEPSSPEGRQHVQFRKTWPAAGAYWTFKLGGDPSPEYRNSFGESQLLALSYARPVAPGDEIRRGRWYVEPGFALKGYTSSGDLFYEYGLKAGFRADTRSFGYIDLYILATQDGTR